MNTTIAPHPRPKRQRDAEPLRLRAELPALAVRPPLFAAPTNAAHDFLVPNPRPDLVLDPQTLRMIERC